MACMASPVAIVLVGEVTLNSTIHSIKSGGKWSCSLNIGQPLHPLTEDLLIKQLHKFNKHSFPQHADAMMGKAVFARGLLLGSNKAHMCRTTDCGIVKHLLSTSI